MAKNIKIALVTGGARRIGAAICRNLHKRNINLIIHYNESTKEAHNLQNELCKIRNDSVKIFKANLTNVSDCKKLIEVSISTFGRLDFLINNASTYYSTKIGEINIDDWEDLLGVNLKAPLFLSQEAAPFLKKTNGSIINITDANINNPKKEYCVYSMAKSGLINLTKSLAKDLAPQVRVNSVAPGPIIWPDTNHNFNEEYKKKVVNQTLLKRIGDPNDIAKAVEYLIDASYVTGYNMKVDGGRSS